MRSMYLLSKITSKQSSFLNLFLQIRELECNMFETYQMSTIIRQSAETMTIQESRSLLQVASIMHCLFFRWFYWAVGLLNKQKYKVVLVVSWVSVLHNKSSRRLTPRTFWVFFYFFLFLIFETENEDISTNFYLENSEIVIIFKKFRNDVSKSLEKW
jgi:hypothetical protein